MFKKNFDKLLIFLPIVILIHLLLLINISFTVWPEMILYPWLINNGYKLYSHIINPYFPLMNLVLASFMGIFGVSVISLKVFTWLVILITDVLIFYFSYQFSKNYFKSLLALVFFILLNINFGGNGLWYELFLIPFILTGLGLTYFKKNTKTTLFIVGLLLGLGVLIKQNAVLFYLPVFYLIFDRKQVKDILFVILPGVFLGLLTYIYLKVQNIILDFVYWAIELPLNYTKYPGFVSLPTKRSYFLILFPLLSLLGLYDKRFKLKDKVYWTMAFFIALLFAFPRYENFHLQLLAGISAPLLGLLKIRYIFLIIILSSLIFTNSLPKIWQTPDRFLDNQTFKLADKISGLDSVYLLNSPDLSYYFANKLPPKIWATNFPWYFERGGFQENFIANLQYEQTMYVVIKAPLAGNQFDLGVYLPGKVLEYINTNYLKIEEFGEYEIWRKKSNYR